MLIQYSVSNFLSFNEKISFSMVKGRTQKHPGHIIKNKGYRPDLLKTSVIFGNNSAGKTNLIKSLKFAKDFIVKGIKKEEAIPLKTYKFDDEKKNTKFEFDLLLNEKIYNYSFEINIDKVVEEKLIEVKKQKDSLIFHRISDEKKAVIKKANFEKIIGKNKKKEKLEFDFILNGTNKNKLLLTEFYERNKEYFLNLYEWFKNDLEIVFPDTTFKALEFMLGINDFKEKFIDYLSMFDVGITDLQFKKMKKNENLFIDLPYKLKEKIFLDLDKKITRNNKTLIIVNDEKYIVSKDKNKNLIFEKLFSKYHFNKRKKDYLLDMSEESDGTNRLLEILPYFVLSKRPKTIFIDEINRSLHPLITKNLFKLFFKINENNRNQLIVTTHETYLMNQNLFRKDEFWFINKNLKRESEMYSLEEYDVRFDNKIYNWYFNGRFDAIPFEKKEFKCQATI